MVRSGNIVLLIVVVSHSSVLIHFSIVVLGLILSHAKSGEKRKKLNDAICLRGAQEIRPRPAEILSEFVYEIKDEVNQFDPEERLR
jgi:hypothetical protein